VTKVAISCFSYIHLLTDCSTVYFTMCLSQRTLGCKQQFLRWHLEQATEELTRNTREFRTGQVWWNNKRKSNGFGWEHIWQNF